MPGYLRGVSRDQNALVKISKTQPIYYNFTTKSFASLVGISDADLRTQLGHLDAAPTGVIVFVRSNSPKPPRVSKRIRNNPTAQQQGIVSTYCGVNDISKAISEHGWSFQKRGRGVRLTNNNRTISAIAKLSTGVLVVEPKNADDVNSYAGPLGLILPGTINTAAEQARLVWGASFPKVGRAEKPLGLSTTTQKEVSVTMPFSTDAADNLAQNGWNILYDEQV
jgi:hypothetical protein